MFFFIFNLWVTLIVQRVDAVAYDMKMYDVRQKTIEIYSFPNELENCGQI